MNTNTITQVKENPYSVQLNAPRPHAMKPKRYRAPKQQPGVLKAQWGKLHGREDLLYVWGEGCFRGDSRLLHNVLSRHEWDRVENKPEPTFLEELEQRGYDLTTLRFSIKKKATGTKTI